MADLGLGQETPARRLSAGQTGIESAPPILAGALVLKIRAVHAAWSAECRFVLTGAALEGPFVQVVLARVGLCLHEQA